VSAAAPVLQPDHARSGERGTEKTAGGGHPFRGGGLARLAALSPTGPGGSAVVVAWLLAVLRRRSHLPEPHPTEAAGNHRRGATAGAPEVPEPAPRASPGPVFGRRAHLRVAVGAGVAGLLLGYSHRRHRTWGDLVPCAHADDQVRLSQPRCWLH